MYAARSRGPEGGTLGHARTRAGIHDYIGDIGEDPDSPPHRYDGPPQEYTNAASSRLVAGMASFSVQ